MAAVSPNDFELSITEPPWSSDSRRGTSMFVTDPKKPSDTAGPAVISLDRYRDRLAQGQRSRRAEALFASSDPIAAIRALPPDEFFYVIHEVGFPEAMDIFIHGTAEQVQTVLDFSVWNHDRVDLEKGDDWLAALVEVPPATLGRWAQGIDVELLALLIRQRTTIHDLSLEESPDEPDGVLWTTPDRLFDIDIKGDPDQTRVTQHLLDSLYRYSPDMMRRLLVGIRAESDAEMEETAYRWRSGRMADLGFADFYEALAVYQELDPGQVRIGAPSPESTAPAGDANHLRLPAAMAERLSGKTPFARGVAGLQSREVAASVHSALVALANRVLSADRVTPGDDEAVRGALERMACTLDLAVEFLAHGAPEREVLAVAGVPPVILHRLGFSLTAKLRRLAVTLVRKNPFAALAPAVDLFEPEDAEVLASLSRPRPVFPRRLDSPPGGGDRPFGSLADLATAGRAVERAAAAVDLLVALGVRPAQLSPDALAAMSATAGLRAAVDPSIVDSGSVARTALIRRLLGHPTPPWVVSAKDIAEFKQSFTSDGQLSETAITAMLVAIKDARGEKAFEGAAAEVAERWIASLSPLGTTLGDDAALTP
jgi:hypothetical protein